MRQLHSNAFKWKPFDLYNDICIQQKPKINVKLLKTATRIKDNCCCTNDHLRFHSLSTNKNHRNTNSENIKNEKNPTIYFCAQCRSIYNFNVVFGQDKINENNNCGANWNALHLPLNASPNSDKPFVNIASNEMCKFNENNNNNNKHNAIEIKRDVENTSPISVYGPLPYSK